MAPIKTLVVLFIALSLLAPSGAIAQYGGGGGSAPPDAGASEQPEEKKKKKAPKRRWGRKKDDEDSEAGWGTEHVVSARNGKRISRANEMMANKQHAEAHAELDKLIFRNLNPVEKVTVLRIRGYIEYGLEDNDKARDYFEQAIAVEDGMSPRNREDLRYTIAQLYLSDENWIKAIEHLNLWFDMTKTPNGGAYFLLGLAHYQNGDLGAALEPVQTAVDISAEPEQNWLQLLLALRLVKKNYKASLPIVEELVQRFPKKAYWKTLSTIHGALGNYEEALVPLQLAYTQGLLDQDAELRRLAQLLLFLELPYRAARVLDQGIEDGVIEVDPDVYEMLGNSWIAAREYEKTVDPLEKAAELAENGDLYVRLAQVHIQREKWSAATSALRHAIDKGELTKPGDARLLMGIAFYSQERPKQARRWFTQARAHEDSRNEAGTWITHIDRELAQQESGASQ
jgi:tetratricopeptide (TPR) repeat protein